MQLFSRTVALKINNQKIMKYTSNTFSANITRAIYLQDEKIYDLVESVSTRNNPIEPNDVIVVISPHTMTPDYMMKIVGCGAGATVVGADKDDNKRLYSYATFRHTKARKKSSVAEIDIDAVAEELFHLPFKDDDSRENFIQPLRHIVKGLSKCDQSIEHMMAKYAVNYEKTKSKGNCGITRNCRNIFTIDCDEKISYEVLINILTGNDEVAEDDDIIAGIHRMRDLVYRIYELHGALPHIVYNSESSHFQLQYLMRNPIYVTEDSMLATYNSISAAKRDELYQCQRKKDWCSVFYKGFNEARNKYKVNDLYETVRRHYNAMDRIVLVMLDYKGEVVHTQFIQCRDFIQGNLRNKELIKAAKEEYVPTVDLGIEMFNIARGCKLLVDTPEYILYGNAHKNLCYLNIGPYKFVDPAFNYCANKSLSIGTRYSSVFDFKEDEIHLTRVMLHKASDSDDIITTPFDLLDSVSWQLYDKYAIDAEFVAFIGSLDSAARLFDENIEEEFAKFKKETPFMYKTNVPMDKCIQQSASKHNVKKAREIEREIAESDRAYHTNVDVDYSAMYDEAVNRLKDGPKDIDRLCFKYLGYSYKACIEVLLRKIFDHTINGDPISRHRFDYISGMHIFYKAFNYNSEFCTACKTYSESLVMTPDSRQMIDEVSSIINSVFEYVVHDLYANGLPGTSNPGNYQHKFNLCSNITRTNPAIFGNVLKKKNKASTTGVVNGAMATILWSGSTKLEVIPNMLLLTDAFYATSLEAKPKEHNPKSRAKSVRPLYRSAWKYVIDESFNSPECSLSRMSRLFKRVQYKTTSGIKYITRRELEDTGVSYLIKKDKHIAEYCLESTSHFREKEEHGNISKYIASLEYFTEMIKDLRREGNWCIDTTEDNIEPPLEDAINNSGLNIEVGGKYAVKDRAKILHQVKTYRYFTKMYIHISSTLNAVDEESDEEHIILLRNATHELYDELTEFLNDLYDVLKSYTTEEECKHYTENDTIVNVEDAIQSLIDKIELHYSTVDFFGYCYEMDYGESLHFEESS